MFVDLRGFTTLASQLPPRELIDILRKYQAIAVPIVHRHHGSITTYLGDGIMVTFGASKSSHTYCADALRCSIELLQALGQWHAQRLAAGVPAPGVGIGVDSGTVTCGVIGDEGRLEYAIIGDPVNRAAKLQNHTKVEHVRGLASGACHARALEQGLRPDTAVLHLESCNVAGVVEPMQLVVLGEAPRQLELEPGATALPRSQFLDASTGTAGGKGPAPAGATSLGKAGGGIGFGNGD